MSVTVYSTPTCPWCKRVKDYLSEHHVEFRDINVAEDREAAVDIVQKTGQMGVPIIDIDGEYILGFDKEAIDDMLKL